MKAMENLTTDTVGRIVDWGSGMIPDCAIRENTPGRTTGHDRATERLDGIK